MTRQEQARFRRLEKRNDSLFSALCIIKTWLAFPDDDGLKYHIAALCERHIQEEKRARAKEDAHAAQA